VSAHLIARGKVREIYDAGEGRLVMVASDRISAYDAVLPTEIPDKGRVLTGLSAHWFQRTADIVPNHMLSTRLGDLPEEFQREELAGRAMLVRGLEMVGVECVARGYLAGSGWRDYLRDGTTSGVSLPAGLRQAERLPEPVFTPATKAVDGHDENVSELAAAEIAGAETVTELARLTLEVYGRAADDCARAGIILADTKLEFGRDADGVLTLGDEVVTPDSSRFWPADSWRPGASPPSFDKQFVRDHLDAVGWDHTPPPPPLSPEVVRGTRERYLTAFERIAGRPLEDYVRETRA
jgi:phosphoribosylaminoimidazole-succinocarboxamide synthase